MVLSTGERKSDVTLRQPQVTDGAQVWSLIRKTKVLDLNSEYCYLMLSAYFQETCMVSEWRNQIVGYVSAFRAPTRPDVLFVWQVAVDENMRGRGLGTTMLSEVLRRDACRGVRTVETTVSPDNAASEAMFRKFARNAGAEVSISVGFPPHLFSVASHEEERLLRISPIRTL